MLIARCVPRCNRVPASQITPESAWSRRRVLAAGAAALGTALAPGAARPAPGDRLRGAASRWSLDDGDDLTAESDATSYNNFFEFGTAKTDPAEHAHRLTVHPWTLTVAGECEAPGRLAVEDLARVAPIEERVYRLRCVEAWSMVIPWLGVPLAPVLARFRPTSRARYVTFETVYRPSEMPGQRVAVLDWPYVEGLRIDEAMHPLAFLALGLYGRELPGQNGAPVRLVVPWKYGYKSIKSVVAMRFVEEQPPTSWNRASPGQYGFYSNVNPEVSNVRWNQRRERRITGSLFSFLAPKIATRLFNGYADEVAHLYAGMDLHKWH